MIGVLLLVATGWCAQTAVSAGTAGDLPGMQAFERNTRLGEELTRREGTAAELDEVQKLSESGLRAARELVATKPASAEAQYMLGSWLLYAYEVAEVEDVYIDEAGMEQTRQVRGVRQGLAADLREGLEALRRAMELAPTRGQYALDYAAALIDMDRPVEAMGVLKTAWAGQPPLTAAERMRAGLMLSDSYLMQQRLAAARDWLYAALEVSAENAEAVRRLRWLDAETARAGEAAAEEPETEEMAPEAEEWETPEEYDPGAEESPEEVMSEEEQSGAAWDAEPEIGGEEEAG